MDGVRWGLAPKDEAFVLEENISPTLWQAHFLRSCPRGGRDALDLGGGRLPLLPLWGHHHAVPEEQELLKKTLGVGPSLGRSGQSQLARARQILATHDPLEAAVRGQAAPRHAVSSQDQLV